MSDCDTAQQLYLNLIISYALYDSPFLFFFFYGFQLHRKYAKWNKEKPISCAETQSHVSQGMYGTMQDFKSFSAFGLLYMLERSYLCLMQDNTFRICLQEINFFQQYTFKLARCCIGRLQLFAISGDFQNNLELFSVCPIDGVST